MRTNKATGRTTGIGRLVAVGGAALALAAPGALAGLEPTSIMINETDGKVTVIVDGETVPPERIEHKDGVLIVRDADGKVIQRLGWGGVAPRATTISGGEKKKGLHTKAEAPPVMVGVNMSEPGAALRYHLGLAEGAKAILLDRVVPGLPAEEAGLRQYDVIVSIDGSEGATSAMLGKVLRSKQPGDTLELMVIRGGKPSVVKVELAAYDASKLRTSSSAYTIEVERPSTFWSMGEDWGDLDPDALAERIARHAERFGGVLDGKRLVFRDPQGLSMPGSRGGWWTSDPSQREAIEARLHELEALLEARLEDLAERLEMLAERIERRLDAREDDED